MPTNVQGGKAFGLLKEQQKTKLDEINKEYLEDQKYRDEEDLPEKLEGLKNKYAEFDLNDQGEIDLMGLKRMMEKLGVPKTHLELKKMIVEVTGGSSSNTINYRDFVKMMLGKRSAVLKLVLIFEDKANGSPCKPEGPPPKRDIASLPQLQVSASRLLVKQRDHRRLREIESFSQHVECCISVGPVIEDVIL